MRISRIYMGLICVGFYAVGVAWGLAYAEFGFPKWAHLAVSAAVGVAASAASYVWRNLR